MHKRTYSNFDKMTNASSNDPGGSSGGSSNDIAAANANADMTLEEIFVPSMSNNRRGSNDCAYAYAGKTTSSSPTDGGTNSPTTVTVVSSIEAGGGGNEVGTGGEVITTTNSMTVPSGGNDDDDINHQGGAALNASDIEDHDIAKTIEIGNNTNHNNANADINGNEGDASSHTSGWGEGDQSSHGASTTDTGYTPTTLNDTTGGAPNGGEDSPLNIARKENRAVSLWRIFMFCVLITTTYAVAALVYAFTSNFEAKEFESAFADDTLKIYESLGSSLDTKLAAVDSLAMLMVSSAREKGETFPFTTLTDFASKAAKTRILSNAIALQQYQYVIEDDRDEWELYAKANEQWVQNCIDVERVDTTFRNASDSLPIANYKSNNTFSTSIRYGGDVAVDTGPYTPSWQTYPMLPNGNFSAYNYNAINHMLLGPGIDKLLEDHKVILGPVLNYEDDGENIVTSWAARHVPRGIDASEPIIRMLYPILDTASNGGITINEPNSNVVGIVAASYFWRTFLENILPFGERGVVVVFNNTCNQTFTYEINGEKAKFLGSGDLHDIHFGYLNQTLTFEEIGLFSSLVGNYGGLPVDHEHCAYTVSCYPSQTMKDKHYTNNPTIFTIIACCIFIFTALVFMGYDKLVTMRQQKVMKAAIQSTAIVSSLFPAAIVDRMLAVPDDKKGGGGASMFQPTKTRLRTFLNDGEPSESSKPIADLFTDTTVLFADIAGFTAWSSVREPSQVFTLLETIYSAFDTIAARRGVFKVETIGDSYVAVTGLPDPRKDHAVCMVKFARDCRTQFNVLCSILESSLGPETGDLLLRIGIHSGPVTAGVLRGQKSRFQLFGDTVNTAARMESTGVVNKIQCSQATADLLTTFKKPHWLTPRDEMVEAKGKGMMSTFWVEPKSVAHSVTAGSTATRSNSIASGADAMDTTRISSQTERLLNWNIDVLERLLKKIVARRSAIGKEKNDRSTSIINWNRAHDKMVLNEVKEVIKLPEYNSKYNDIQNDDPDSIILDNKIRIQLREYVTAIAATYSDANPFHNFPHASHVAMSVAKLLSRIVGPDQDFESQQHLHDHTYGITSDPLTQFACVFSALIHDVDHSGVPNSQLVKEDTEVSRVYKGRSVAEQNSINISWNILIEPKYADLRKAICDSRQAEVRFRQLVVNAVCATDIMDKDLKTARNERWEKAFSTIKPAQPIPSNASRKSFGSSSPLQDRINRKATIVIEHIIQASDVSHTMQHWHIYIKWNERLFAEMYKAFIEGRAEKDPTDSWYKGEIGFFDFYIIPLATKLNECGVFGVSSDEYLNYAMMNRNEWEKKGEDVVESYVKKYKQIEHVVTPVVE